ncbi:hypothetical protein [Arthrobacter sp. ISL-69]|uniref:hypothetical protein n=1 Tax=Arthrobacter sp. ISL-69 TaxID=2819113 RepID=UPI001BEA3F30|nr:hypothetical protein [Arthrobacter sp. ISL-69]MBT2536272.1 hypothetical protein [Arthrobacter sp. ISL-69]
MIDRAIAALNVLYWTVVAAWFVVLVTDNDSLTGWGSAGFVGTALVAVCGWHLLRHKRKKLQATNDTGVVSRNWPGG